MGRMVCVSTASWGSGACSVFPWWLAFPGAVAARRDQNHIGTTTDTPLHDTTRHLTPRHLTPLHTTAQHKGDRQMYRATVKIEGIAPLSQSRQHETPFL